MEGNFECKVSRKSESGSGIFLTLQIQPDDYTEELATLRVGSKLVLGWAEVVNTDVEPIEVKAEGQESEANGSPKKWSELARSQQAYLLTRDQVFLEYFGAKNAANCDGMLKGHFRISSKSDLDQERYHKPWDEFVALYHLHRGRLK